MPDLAMLDYFYGDEAEQFTFYRIPKVLFTDPSYRRISSDAKILYGLMLDRMGLSVRNGWLDEYNRVFIFFTLEDALEYLCCGHTLLDMLNACECREDDENFKSAVDLLFEQLEQRNPDHFAARQYKKFKMAAGKTLKSILISCGARLAPFDIAAVREMMSYDELELEKLGDEKTALFAVVSDTDPTFNFISAMMYSQMFNVLCDRALKVYHGRLPIHVTCLFDEFANQKIPNWEHLVSVIRSRNISAHIVLQTFSQLKGMYKDNAETVAGCCSTMLFLGGKEESSLKMVSGLLGKETIDTMNESDSRGAQRTYGLNYQKLGKELMSVDELAVMPSSRCIVQVQGVRPFYSKKYDLTKHPQYKYTADANPKFTFDVKTYLQHRLKVKPEEEFEVYDLGEIEQPQAAA